MKVRVDPETCIACGACISLAPEVYDWDENGKAKAIAEEVPEDQENIASEALGSCPTEAIKEV
ncbi:MAG: ferredoxin [Peptococcaceae bacterium]|nr:ferredoxin [Peptococcaceae bacterium]MDH7524265.1 ferredoxin [Peptococcaceae bacterium]